MQIDLDVGLCLNITIPYLKLFCIMLPSEVMGKHYFSQAIFLTSLTTSAHIEV